MNLIDFSDCRIDRHSDYAGSDRKNAIIYQGDRYMIKFSERQEPKNDYGTSCVNNVLSEYIGSHIFSDLGIPTHETLLGTYHGELVVACKNFLQPGETLHEFSWYLRNQYDSSNVQRTPVLPQIYQTIAGDPDLLTIERDAVDRYWDTFVVDALIGNFDRHAGNWGYIIGADDVIRLAPVYDCGSCLFSGLSVDMMQEVLSSEYGVARRLYEFPKAALLVEGKKVGYYDMMASGYDRNCDLAVLRIYPRMKMERIREILEETPVIAGTRKEFYLSILEKRLAYIVERAYRRISQNKHDEIAMGRIGINSFRIESEAIQEYRRALEEMTLQ